MKTRKKDIGDQKVGLGKKETFNFVMAATPELGSKFVEDMTKLEGIHDYVKSRYCLGFFS